MTTTPTPPMGGGGPVGLPTQLLARLDRLLFEPTGWFVIDHAQTKIDDVDSLAAGLAAVAATGSAAAAVVGRLAPGVAAIDVDAGGINGDAVADQLAGWLTAQGRWHLLRPSGGGQGRWHVLCVPGDDTNALTDYVRDLATTHGLSARELDHRGAGGGAAWLRPLSSPHRATGHVPAPVGTLRSLRTSATHLKQALGDLTPPRRVSARQRRAEKDAQDASRQRRAQTDAPARVVALVPLPRPQRPLDGPWGDWVSDRGPAPILGGADQSRSAFDLAATSAMVRAGLDVDDAWERIQTSTGAAFIRTRQRGRSWWIRHQWNTAVASDTAWRAKTFSQNDSERPPTTRTATQASEHTQTAVQAARTALLALQWAMGARQRHSVVLVAHTLLDRMLREDVLTVPCPLRNLEEDTGLARGTVLAALRALHGPLGRRLETFDHTKPDASSHEFELDPRFANTGLSLLEPPGTTPTPQPSLPPGTWACLPPLAHSVWRALGDGEGTSLEDVGCVAGVAHGDQLSPTVRQLRTLRTHLGWLASAGLAVSTGEGRWCRSFEVTPAHARRAAATCRRIRDRVASERQAYRGRTHLRWHRQRLDALRRNRARQEAWWAQLSVGEQTVRRHRRADAFLALPQATQLAQKTAWAHRRAQAGDISETLRHARWSRQHTATEQAEISARWQARFASLPPPERVTRLSNLHTHRQRWHLPPSWSSGTPDQGRPHHAAA